jgi:hypothetical protein
LQRRFVHGISAALAAFVFSAGVTNAEGVTRVQQSDGSIQIYRHVDIRLAGQTLWLRSPDRRGTLEVASDACSFTGEIQRCLPFAATLHQAGKTHDIVLERGTVYVNLTDAVYRVPHSSERLGAHAVLVLLHTARGTIISVKGKLDTVK